MLVRRYQDVIEELFWCNDVFQQDGALADLIETVVEEQDRESFNYKGGAVLYEKAGRQLLATAAPYFISHEVHTLLNSVCATLPHDTVIAEHMFPTNVGWARRYDVEPPKHGFVGVGWLHAQVPDNVLRLGDYTIEGRVGFFFNILGVYPPIGHVTAMPFGMGMWPCGWSLERVLTMYQDPASGLYTQEERDSLEKLFRYIASLALFMDQDIVVRERGQIDRGTRRRLEGYSRKPLANSDVHVVKLRRLQQGLYERRDEPLDHAFRWWVGWPHGHWRTLHRGTDKQRTVFVRPHLKGPEDKPVKAPATRVFTVVR